MVHSAKALETARTEAQAVAGLEIDLGDVPRQGHGPLLRQSLLPYSRVYEGAGRGRELKDEDQPNDASAQEVDKHGELSLGAPTNEDAEGRDNRENGNLEPGNQFPNSVGGQQAAVRAVLKAGGIDQGEELQD